MLVSYKYSLYWWIFCCRHFQNFPLSLNNQIPRVAKSFYFYFFLLVDMIHFYTNRKAVAFFKNSLFFFVRSLENTIVTVSSALNMKIVFSKKHCVYIYDIYTIVQRCLTHEHTCSIMLWLYVLEMKHQILFRFLLLPGGLWQGECWFIYGVCYDLTGMLYFK